MRFILTTFSLFVVGAVASAADQVKEEKKDLLDEARRRDQVAQQKVEADFRAAFVELNKLEFANPTRAAERLKKLVVVLDDDTILSPAKREAWKRVLKDRIHACEVEADRAAQEQADKATIQIKKDDRRITDDQKSRDDQRLKQDLKTAAQMQKDGRIDEAARIADDAARRNPDKTAAAASKTITSRADAVRQARLVRDERNNGWTLSMMDVEKSSVIPKDPDINFPSPEKWREITKRRNKSQATETEKAILRALDSPLTVSFEGSTLESVIDYLQTLSGQTIILDKQTLEAAGINYDTPVNIRKMRASLRSVLRKVLGEVGLTYIVEKETIHAVTLAEAKKKMTVRTYYLGDMAGMVDFTFGPAYGWQAQAATIAMLIQTIVGSVEPDSWKINNAEADGTIFYDPATMTLVVKQSAEIHYMLGGFGR
jgi:hypothetical protein